MRLTCSSAMILSPSSSSSLVTGGEIGGGVAGFGLVSGGSLLGFVWRAGGGASSSPSCKKGCQIRRLSHICIMTTFHIQHLTDLSGDGLLPGVDHLTRACGCHA